jgi:hypothetical protein
MADPITNLLAYEKVWTNDQDFPTYEGNEEQVREDFQYHPDAIQTYINEVLISKINEVIGENTVIVVGTEDPTEDPTLLENGQVYLKLES